MSDFSSSENNLRDHPAYTAQPPSSEHHHSARTTKLVLQQCEELEQLTHQPPFSDDHIDPTPSTASLLQRCDELEQRIKQQFSSGEHSYSASVMESKLQNIEEMKERLANPGKHPIPSMGSLHQSVKSSLRKCEQLEKRIVDKASSAGGSEDSISQDSILPELRHWAATYHLAKVEVFGMHMWSMDTSVENEAAYMESGVPE